MTEITLTYKCRCLPDEVEFKVRQREPGEDVVHWMDKIVRTALGADHTQRSPWCTATNVEYCKVPVPPNEDGRIGESTKH